MTYTNYSIPAIPNPNPNPNSDPNDNQYQVIAVPYDVNLWACYQSDGCNNQFATDSKNNDVNKILEVLNCVGAQEVKHVEPTKTDNDE